MTDPNQTRALPHVGKFRSIARAMSAEVVNVCAGFRPNFLSREKDKQHNKRVINSADMQVGNMLKHIDDVVNDETCNRRRNRAKSKRGKKTELLEKSRKQVLKEEYAHDQMRVRMESKRLAAIEREVEVEVELLAQRQAAENAYENKLQSHRNQQVAHWSQVAEKQRSEASKYSRYCQELKHLRRQEKNLLQQKTAPSYEQWERNGCQMWPPHVTVSPVSNSTAGADVGLEGGDEEELSNDFGAEEACRPTELMRLMMAADPRVGWTARQSCTAGLATSHQPHTEVVVSAARDRVAVKDGASSSRKHDIRSYNVLCKQRQERLQHTLNSEASILATESHNATQLRLADELRAQREAHERHMQVVDKLNEVVDKLDTMLEQRERDFEALIGQSVLTNYSPHSCSTTKEQVDLEALIQRLRESREQAERKRAAADIHTRSMNRKLIELMTQLNECHDVDMNIFDQYDDHRLPTI